MDPNTPTQPGRNGGTLRVGGTGLKPGTKHKTTVITDAIIEALEANDCQLARQFVKSLVVNAMKGNGSAMKILVDRAEGVLESPVNLTVDDVSNLSDEDRASRIAAVYDAARTRALGQVAVECAEQPEVQQVLPDHATD